MPGSNPTPPTDDAAGSPAVKRVKLASGVTLEYAEQGSAGGVPVVLLHGFTDSWRSFERVLSYLPESIHAFAPSQRGYGDSDRPESTYLIGELAEDLAQFLDAVGVESAFIVGHSMGSMVAERFAIDHPSRTRGLLLAGTNPSLKGNPACEDFNPAVQELEDPIDPAFVKAFQESTLARPVPEEFLAMVVAESLKVPARIWKAAFAGFLQTDFARELHRIQAPTHIVFGDQDIFMTLADHEAVRSRIPGSRMTTYEGAGHAMHWEEPSRFAADLVTFVEQIAAKRNR
ncbi:MAG TPA: alpha/beta hydrolase [Dehalococcoidia bacterium]|nr:alpha/beta hydrolase [Dehalococcoidia bacterium]